MSPRYLALWYGGSNYSAPDGHNPEDHEFYARMLVRSILVSMMRPARCIYTVGASITRMVRTLC